MTNFAILMFVFAVCLLLCGLYMYTGHKLDLIKWKAAFKHATKEEWKNIGKWVMLSSIIFFVIAIIGLLIGG